MFCFCLGQVVCKSWCFGALILSWSANVPVMLPCVCVAWPWGRQARVVFTQQAHGKACSLEHNTCFEGKRRTENRCRLERVCLAGTWSGFMHVPIEESNNCQRKIISLINSMFYFKWNHLHIPHSFSRLQKWYYQNTCFELGLVFYYTIAKWFSSFKFCGMIHKINFIWDKLA